MKTTNLTNLTKYPDKSKVCQDFEKKRTDKTDRQNQFVRAFCQGWNTDKIKAFNNNLTILTINSLEDKNRGFRAFRQYMKLPKSPNERGCTRTCARTREGGAWHD